MNKYWEAVERNNFDVAYGLEAELRQTLLFEEPALVDKHFKKNAWKIYFNNGMVAIFKPAELAAIAPELDAHRLDILLRFLLTPPISRRTINGKEGTIQLFVPDSEEGGKDLRRSGAEYPSDRMYAFDYLLSNLDRHETNWLRRRASKMAIAIDNALIETHPLHPYAKEAAEGKELPALQLRAVNMDVLFELIDFQKRIKKGGLGQMPRPDLMDKVMKRVQELIDYTEENTTLGTSQREPLSLCRQLFIK